MYTSFNRLGREAMETDAEEIIEMAARTSKDHKTASPLPPRQSGLTFAIGGDIYLIKWATPHKDAGQGCFIKSQADAGTVLAFYPGVIYSPAFYRYIPGYPKVDSHNSYLITRYDGTVINAQPWVSVENVENYGLTAGSNGLDASVLKTLVLVATRELCDEELLLNYRLTNSKRRPD
ncbi:hypothetical protein IGI04_008485 [Brassica rapa subsp. trilocularis]|nr:hypothetical protein IGI04_008485 [Brassica rapa subsp. trilocularis]